MREHDCDPWHRAGMADEWVCPTCGTTWAYLSTHKGTGWYRAGAPRPGTSTPRAGTRREAAAARFVRRCRGRCGGVRQDSHVTRPRLLDLFCGAGGAAVGYHRAGFDVTGVDIDAQPEYPFAFVQHIGEQLMAHLGVTT